MKRVKGVIFTPNSFSHKEAKNCDVLDPSCDGEGDKIASEAVDEEMEIESPDDSASASDKRIREYPDSIYEHSSERYLFLFCIALATNCSTISIPIYFPTLSALAQYFHTSVEKINVTATMYSIFQGISPIFWAAISDACGRRPVYFGCLIVYLCANVGLALAPNYAALFCLRCLQAFGAASTVSLSGGVVGDITSRKTRGHLIGIAMGCGQLGNCFGPLIGGGVMNQFNSWRAIYWFLTIMAGVVLTIVAIFLPETNRHVVGNGSRAPPPQYPLSWSPYVWIRSRARGLPFKYGTPEYNSAWCLPPVKVKWLGWADLFFQPDVLLILIPTSLHYTAWYMSLTAQSTILSSRYGFNTLQIGYTYLASGIGTFTGSIGTGKLLQWNYRRMARKNPKNPDVYRARLLFAAPASAILIMAMLVFGWTLHFHTTFYVPVVMTFFIAITTTQFLNSTSALLVDLFPNDSAASQSCNNLARCLIAAGGLAAVDRMMQTMTIGGTFTFMAGICGLSMVCIWAELRWGASISQARAERLNEKIRQELSPLEKTSSTSKTP